MAHPHPRAGFGRGILIWAGDETGRELALRNA
jgi:hypothetical protein